VEQRPPEKLEDGKHMLYGHALRCFCKLCGALLNWECPEDISYTETECCGFSYRLQPWTVKVRIEDVSSRPVLPQMEGSDYSDPAYEFPKEQIIGLPDPHTYVIRARKPKKRCGICRRPGHNRKTCPEA